ncbi:MAG: hypothetical protein ABS92_06780 [Thiobacillus sp. SCN 63-374]|nr:MAG: hypothetical protein ABS92_06780 [Thiobacillus sp. SCN 63-374]
MSNYTIPKGRIYFDDGNGEEYLGNTPGADLGIESTTLDHFSAESGIREKDDSALVEITRTLTITADDISTANWARFIIGTVGAKAQTAVAVADATLGATPLGKVKQGRHYQLGVTTDNPSGVRAVTGVAIKVGAATMVLNTDYTLDATLARIYIIPGGGIADDDIVLESYTPTAGNREQVISASSAATSGAMRFVADNPKGTNRDIFLPSVNLKPTGTAQLKGENAEWMQLGFEIEILKKDASTGAIYIDGRNVATP